MMLRHLEHGHEIDRTIGRIASGGKQLRIIKALYDNDSIFGKTGENYLQVSAKLIRDIWLPADARFLSVDRFIIMLLTEDGPQYIPEFKLADMDYIKRSGMKGIYYTREFANWCYNEVMLTDGRMKTLRTRYIQKSQ